MQKRFNDLVTFVRNGVAVPALVVNSQLQADGREFLSVLYADPSSGPTLVISGQTRKVGSVELSVPPITVGAGFGWFNLPVNDAHAAMLSDHADAAEWNNRLGDHPGTVAPGAGGYPEGHEQAYGGAVPRFDQSRLGVAPYNNQTAVPPIDPALIGTPGIHVPLSQRQVLESDQDKASRLRNLDFQHPPAVLISADAFEKAKAETAGSGTLRYQEGDNWTQTGDGTDYPGSYGVGPDLKVGDDVRVIEANGQVNPKVSRITKIDPGTSDGQIFFVDGGDSKGYFRDRVVRMRSSALPVPVPQTPTAVPDNLPEGYAPIMPTDPTSVESVEAAKAAALAGNPQYETRTYSDESTRDRN